MRRCWLAPFIAALVTALPAHAAEVWRTEKGKLSWDASGFYKTFGAGLRLPGGLVEGTEALADVLDETRAALPPEQVDAVPSFATLPRDAALSTHVLRLSTRLTWDDRLIAEVAYELGASMASDGAFAGGAAFGAPVGPAAVAQRRLVDLDDLLLDTGTMQLRQNLDRLALRLALPGVELVVGRQVLGWGTGRLWNPTDLLSPFAPTDIDKEVRKGVDAFRASIPLGDTGLLDALWLPQTALADQGGVVRAQVNVLSYDVSLSVAKYVSDVVVGADFAGDAGPLGIYGEATYTLGVAGWKDGSLSVQERFVRAVAGAQWRPHERLFLLGEYYFNGFGARSPEDYLARLQSPRVARGEIFGAGRHYMGLVASWLATDLVTVNATVIVNLQDPSAMLSPVLEWSVDQSVLLRLGAFVPLGRGPDPSGLQALTVNDVLAHSSDFREATTSLGLRSEYGASAAGVLLELAVYR